MSSTTRRSRATRCIRSSEPCRSTTRWPCSGTRTTTCTSATSEARAASRRTASYEHAYARDFGATPDGRKQYVDAFFRNLDWDHVNRQLFQAEAAKQGADQSGAAESPEFAPAS